MHIYPNQNTYNVKLTAVNQQCSDSILVLIDTRHALNAAFTIDNDSVCQGTIVNFANASNYSTLEGPAKFLWSISDGTLDTNLGFAHLFPNAGLYDVQLIVTDFVPCSDTAYGQVLVDSASNIVFTLADSTLCEGQNISFNGTYFDGGLNSILWDFGDGTLVANQQQVQHAYDSAGVYSVTVAADYRLCPDPSSTSQILVNPFPSINLGPDTSICPGDAPLVIRDLTNFNNPAAIWTWNTGDSGVSSVAARHPGIYTARVSVAGCATSDSVFVSKDCYVDVPNSFTPNNDGVGDHFLPRQLLSQGVTAFVMKIYSRWGQEIFSTSQIDGRGWDGKFNDVEQPTGVYIYTLEATLKSGRTEKSQGNVTLLR